MGEYGIRQKVWNRNYGRRVVGMAKENMDGKTGKEHMSGEIGIGDIEGGGYNKRAELYFKLWNS